MGLQRLFQHRLSRLPPPQVPSHPGSLESLAECSDWVALVRRQPQPLQLVHGEVAVLDQQADRAGSG